MTKLLARALDDAFALQVQLPIAASDVSEPEPDLSVVPVGDYLDDHPKRALLAIEVADSSGRVDRKIKSRLYAECGIPEYWIVDVVKSVVEVLRDPRDGAYQTITKHGRGETLRPSELPAIELRVDDFLPPR